MDKDKIAVIVELFKVDSKKFRISDWNFNNDIIKYGEYRLWLLYECMYWYAIEVNTEYYAFDISGIISTIRFDNLEQKDRNNWLLRFIKCLESSEYFIDFESSIKRCLKPMLPCTKVTNKYKFLDLFSSIVKWIKRFHFSFDNSLF